MSRLCGAALWILLAATLPVSAQTATPGSTSTGADSSSAQEPLPEAPAPATKPKVAVMNWEFKAATGALFAASIANSETLYGCDNCTAISAPLHRRGVTYGVAMPVDAAVSYLGYELKKKGHRWWYLPSVALTAANAYLAYHWKVNTD
jgi:hypothetical protein